MPQASKYAENTELQMGGIDAAGLKNKKPGFLPSPFFLRIP
jgi:hypothetical protein